MITNSKLKAIYYDWKYNSKKTDFISNRDILHTLNGMASKQIKVQQDLFIVPDSTSTAFPREGLTLSPQACIPVCPTVSISILNDAFKSR